MADGKFTRVRGLYMAQESGGYAVDPSSDGSGYTAVELMEGRAWFPDRGASIGDTDYAVRRNRRTAHQVLPFTPALTLQIPAKGLTAAAGDAATPSWTSAIKMLLDSLYGAPTAVDGEGVAAGSTASDLALDGVPSNLAAGGLVCVQSAAQNGGAAQWRPVSNGASPFDISPDWAVTPSDSAVAYGSLQWDGDGAQSHSLACVADIDGEIFTMLGGRPTALRLTLNAKQRLVWETTIIFDSKAEDASAKSSLPAVSPITTATIQGTLSPVYWGSTAYPVKSITVDFAPEAEEDESTGGTNGRAGIDRLGGDPRITITPRYARSVWEADFEAGTERALLIQLGGGVISGGVLNTMGLYVPAAQVAELTDQADGNRARHNVVLACNDAGASADYWRLAIA
jgi:hypothetical protein